MRKRSRSRYPSVERLESRQVLAASSLIASTISPPSTTTAVLEYYSPNCLNHSQQTGITYRLPAPFTADINLDGRFNSEDLVAYYRDFADLAVATDGRLGVDTLIDGPRTATALPYTETAEASDACWLEEIVDAGRAQRESWTVFRDPSPLRSRVTYVENAFGAAFRATQQFDAHGNIQNASLNVSASHDQVVDGRWQAAYSETGRLNQFSTWVYDDDGGVLRETVTHIFDIESPVFQRTTVTYFDEAGSAISQQQHYYDQQANELARDDVTLEDGLITVVRTSEFNTTGSVTTVSNRHAGRSVRQLSTQYPNTYLQLAHDAFQAASAELQPEINDVLRMNEPKAFQHLDTILDQGGSSSDQRTRFYNLRRYFQLTSDLAEALTEERYTPLYDQYADVIQHGTGEWQAWFVQFMEDEHLTIPIAPYRIADPPSGSPDSNERLSSELRQVLGENPSQRFEELRQDPRQHVDQLLESMRRVKVQVRILELQTRSSVPVFDWIVADETPRDIEAQFDTIYPLTSWHFFPYREGRGYDRREVSEEVVRERVPRMTDEDGIYVINIEHWALDGTPAEVSRNLAKYKRAADLIHKYNPNLMIGFYRLLPRREASAIRAGSGTAAFEKWQSHNDHVASSLEESVDFIFPSLYTLKLGNEELTTEQVWSTYAEGNLLEAKRVATGKPLIPFLGLYYHPNGGFSNAVTRNLKGWKWLEPEILLYQMLSLHRTAEGVVLYNDLNTSWGELDNAGIVGALDLFNEAKTTGRLDDLKTYYDSLIVEYREELLTKLALEKALIIKLEDQSKARHSSDEQQQIQLQNEIAAIQYVLGKAPPIWQLLQSFVYDE